MVLILLVSEFSQYSFWEQLQDVVGGEFYVKKPKRHYHTTNQSVSQPVSAEVKLHLSCFQFEYRET